MRGVIDVIALSIPLIIAIGALYFATLWKPRHRNFRYEAVFWAALLCVVILVAVYVGFFRS